MSIEKLPTEVFLTVLASCDELGDLVSMALVSRRCNAVAGLQLYRIAVAREDFEIAGWAARNGCLGTLERLVMACKPDVLQAKLNMYAMEIRPWRARPRLVPSVTPSSYGPLQIRCTTALYEAAEGDHLNIVQFLIDHGSNVNMTSSAWPLGLSQCFQDWKSYSANPSSTPDLYLSATPLLAAICGQNADMARLLLHHGASNEISKLADTNPSYMTAFHVAALIGSVEVIDTFLEGGFAKVEQPDGMGYPPLYYAANSPNYRLAMEALKKWGANLDYVVSDDRTLPGVLDRRLVPLLIREGQWTAAARLLEFGASIDTPDDQPTLLELCREVKEIKQLKSNDKERVDQWQELVGVLVDRQSKERARHRKPKKVVVTPPSGNLRRSQRKRH